MSTGRFQAQDQEFGILDRDTLSSGPGTTEFLHCKFKSVNLDGVHLEEIRFVACEIEEDLVLCGSEIPVIDLPGTTVGRTFRLTGLGHGAHRPRIHAPELVVHGGCDGRDAVLGELDLRYSRFAGGDRVDFGSMKIVVPTGTPGGRKRCWGGAWFQYGSFEAEMILSGGLFVRGACFSNACFTGLEARRAVFLGEGLALDAAQGDWMSGQSMKATHVDMRSSRWRHEVDLSRSDIGSLRWTQAEFPDDSESLPSLEMVDTRVRGDLRLDGGSFQVVSLTRLSGNGNVSFRNTRIQQDLCLQEARVRKVLDLTGTRTRRLDLSRSETGEIHMEVFQASECCLSLVRAERVFLSPDRFRLHREPLTRILEILDRPNTDSAARMTAATLPVRTRLLARIMTHADRHHWKARLVVSATTPTHRREADLAGQYSWLVRAFGRLQNFRAQDAAFRRQRIHERRARLSGSGWKAPFLSVLNFLEWLIVDMGTGYGTRPLRVLGLGGLVVLVFGLIYLFMFPDQFVFNPEFMETVSDSLQTGMSPSSSLPMKKLEFAIRFSSGVFLSLGFGPDNVVYRSPAAILVNLEGLLGLLVTTTFVGTWIRKFLRMT